MDWNGFKTLINAIGDGEKNTAAEMRFILDNFLQHIYLPGDIKEVLCTAQELIDDYTATGLGIGKRAGWAQCNGLNGTVPFGGRTAIGFSDVYDQLGFRGGSPDAVVVAHTHDDEPDTNIDYGTGDGIVRQRARSNAEGIGLAIRSRTKRSGESGVGKNMMPFVVVLYLVKLP